MRIKIKKVLVILILMIFGFIGLICSKEYGNYGILQSGLANSFKFYNENMSKERETVLIGDSITKLYPNMIFLSSIEGKVYNRGIIGDTSGKLVDRIQDNALNIKPKNLVINIGINDLYKGVEPQVVANNIDQCISLALSNDETVRIILLSVTPANVSLNDKILETNQLIKDISVKYNIDYVDIHDNLVGENGAIRSEYSYDSLHPNLKAYRVITDELLTYLK